MIEEGEMDDEEYDEEMEEMVIPFNLRTTTTKMMKKL